MDGVIHELENDISMVDYFARRTLTAHDYFSSGSNFFDSEGNDLTFTVS